MDNFLMKDEKSFHDKTQKFSPRDCYEVLKPQFLQKKDPL